MSKQKHVYRRAEIIALIISALIAVLLVASVMLIGLPVGLVVLVGVVVVVGWLFYAVTMRAAYDALDVPDDQKWRLAVPKPEYSNISDHDFNDMRIKMPQPQGGVEEVQLQNGSIGVPDLDCLMWASVRRHWFDLFVKLLPIGAATVLVGVMSVMLPKHAPWWLLPLVLVLAALWGAVEYIRWWMLRWDLTPTHFRRIIRPPAWLPFIDDSVEPFPLANMTASEGGSAIGRQLHYGSLSLKTLYQENEDKDIALIERIPFCAEIAASINMLSHSR